MCAVRMGGKNRSKKKSNISASKKSGPKKPSVKVANKQANKQRKQKGSGDKRQRTQKGVKRARDESSSVKRTANAKRAKQESAAIPSADESSAAPDVTDEDVLFFGKRKQFAGNLIAADLSTKKLSKAERTKQEQRQREEKQKAREKAAKLHADADSDRNRDKDAERQAGSESEDEDRLADFERKPRRFGDKGSLRLPIKDESGRLLPSLLEEHKGPQMLLSKAMAAEASANGEGDETAGDEQLPSGDGDAESGESAATAVNGTQREEAEADEAELAETDTLDDDDDDEVELADEGDGEEGDDELERALAMAHGDAPRASDVELQKKLAQRTERLQGEIAEIAELVLEDPEKNIGKMHKLHELCADADVNVQHLAMLSETEVYRDILPGYKIRLPTEEELKVKVSKDVRKVRDLERSLLNGYARFVTFLITKRNDFFKHKPGQRAHGHGRRRLPQTALVVVKCLCRMLEKGYSFNYRKDLIDAVVPLLNSPILAVRSMCYQSVCSMFTSDIAGDPSLEAVRSIARTAKAKAGKVQPYLLQCFLSLPLSRAILEAEVAPKAKKKKKSTKGKRGQLSKEEEKALEKDMKEGEAEVSVEHRKRVQTAMLTDVFTTYFRILKQSQQVSILPVILKGLAKFAHLINLELVLDLLELLKRLISPNMTPPLSVESALHCIITAFSTLKGHGSAINIDIQEFYAHLYAMMWRLAEPANHAHIPLMLVCMDLMFQSTRQLSTERVASFVMRMASLTHCVPPHAMLAILHSIRTCLRTYPKARQLLDREVTTSGAFLPDLDDPDHSNAFAATAWELGLLKASYHPFVPKYATNLLDGGELAVILSRTPPAELFRSYDCSAGAFNPPVPAPAALVKGTKKDKHRKRMRHAVESPFVHELRGTSQAHGVGLPKGREFTSYFDKLRTFDLELELAKLRTMRATMLARHEAASAANGDADGSLDE